MSFELTAEERRAWQDVMVWFANKPDGFPEEPVKIVANALTKTLARAIYWEHEANCMLTVDEGCDHGLRNGANCIAAAERELGEK